MRRAKLWGVAVAIVSLWVAGAAGVTAVWLTDEVRVFGLVVLPAAIVASLLVMYFDWRGRLVRDIRQDDKGAAAIRGA